MQRAKDTFLMTLRDRLAVVNSARTIAVRGALRPAVVTAENELLNDGDPIECFVVHWLEAQRDTTEPMPLHSMTCEVRFATRGTQEFAEVDRGRVLAEMNAELQAMLMPRFAVLMDYSTAPATPYQTRVFWSETEPAVITTLADRMQAVSKITVFALEEAEG